MYTCPYPALGYVSLLKSSEVRIDMVLSFAVGFVAVYDCLVGLDGAFFGVGVAHQITLVCTYDICHRLIRTL